MLIHCTGVKLPLWSPLLINGACMAQIIKVMELLKLSPYMQMEWLDCLRCFFNYLMHHWYMRCDMTQRHPNVQVPLHIFQLEFEMHFQHMLDSILTQAAKIGQSADEMIAWVCINECRLRQRYAQKLEEEYGQDPATTRRATSSY